MLIVEIVGGLGNQMFQYAFYYKLKSHYADDEAKIYLDRFKETSDNNGFELGNAFGINVSSILYNGDTSSLIDDSMNLVSRIRRKIFGRKNTFFLERVFKYDSKVFSVNRRFEIYFRGLWQDELYFKEVRLELLNVFKFDTSKFNHQNLKVLEKINETNSVSIHIRRGDYISNEKYNRILGGICSYSYYKDALEYLQKKILKSSLFIFSDDIEWVKSEFDFLSNNDIVFVNHNIGSNSYIDMYLMSQCKHNIIANSSFSWWGAWLNTNENKIVLAPMKWFKNNPRLEDNSIVPNSWTKINN